MDAASFRRGRETSLLDLLTRANHLLNDALHAQVKGHGISATEWRVLAVLSERDGMTMSELAETVLFKQPTLTKAIDRMERGLLVQRRTPPEDRRRTLVHITDRGRAIAAPLLDCARRYELRVRDVLGDAETRELEAALLLLIERARLLPRRIEPPRQARLGG